MRAPVPLPHPAGPFSGYRVLDFADEKGQLCARLLAELGADVIKVEPREGDETRRNGPFFRGEAGAETSLWWWAMNAGKRSITCDLRREAGRDLVQQLAGTADVLIETSPPGRAAELGLDYPSLHRRFPRLIVASITNFGQTGPYRNLLATDIVASAMGGHMHLNGDEARGPVRTLAPQSFAEVNFQASVGIAMALYARGAAGAGQHIDVSMQEAMTNAMDSAQVTWDMGRINASGPGVRRNTGGITGAQYLFETADGWVATPQGGGLVGPTAPAAAAWLAETGEATALEEPSLLARLQAAPPLDPADRDTIEAAMARYCSKRQKLALVAEAQRRGLGWAPVFGPREVVECEQLQAREYWVRVHHEDIGESFIYPGAPFRLGRTPWAQRGRAPHLGEHNTEVYQEMGLDDATRRSLRAKMVV